MNTNEGKTKLNGLERLLADFLVEISDDTQTALAALDRFDAARAALEEASGDELRRAIWAFVIYLMKIHMAQLEAERAVTMAQLAAERGPLN